MSRFGGDPRASGSNLGLGGGGGGGGGERGVGFERWDPERFHREREQFERSRGPPAVVERDRFEEHDRFESRGGRGGGGQRRESAVDDFYFSGRPGGRDERFEERDVFVKEDRYGPPARRPRAPQKYYDDEAGSVDVPNRGQMVPFEGHRTSIDAERGYGAPARRPPGRPAYIRRQSSLDTFDRKPMPRYGDRFREPPETIPIPIPRRRRSPPRFVERDYEEDIRIAEPDYYGDEEFRGYREREISTVRRRRPESEVEYKEKEEILEVEEEEERPFPRKGKTRMPKRLVNKRAVIELGYAFEEEDETIIILKALGKEHIDEVIKISKEMKEKGGESHTTYVIDVPASPPPPDMVERRTEIVISPPPPGEIPRSIRDWDVMNDGARSEKSAARSERHSPKGARSEKGGSHTEKDFYLEKRERDISPIEITRKPSRSRRGSHSRHRSRSTAAPKTEYFEEEIGESNSMHGALAVIAPRKDERSIKAEIRALEAERRRLKYERELEKGHRHDRHRDEEIIIEDRNVVKIEKDRKAPDSRLIKAMLATLT